MDSSTKSCAKSLRNKIKIFAKISHETPERMKPTRRSVIFELLIGIFAVSASVIHAVDRDNIVLLYMFCLLSVTVTITAAYYEVDWYAFKLSMTSFRGFCIIIGIIISFITGFCRILLTNDNEPILILIVDNITWEMGIFLMLSVDSVPRISNFIRFFCPLCLFSFTLWDTLDSFYINPTYDYTFLKLFNDKLSINEMEIAAKIQILLYGSTFLWGVPRDPGHNHFVLLDNKIHTKTLLPLRNVATDTTTIWNDKIIIKTSYLFNTIIIAGTVYLLLWIYAVCFRTQSIILIIIATFIVCIILVIICILIYKYFQWFMVQELILQFRCNMLIMTIVIICFTTVMQIVWNVDDTIFTVGKIINNLVFVFTCLMTLMYDGMNVIYPNYFIVYFGLMMMFVSLWNIFVLTFIEHSKYPTWFILLQKQAYYQVIVICYLFIYYLYQDKEHKYFILIRKRRNTKELWGDNVLDSTDCKVIYEHDVNGSKNHTFYQENMLINDSLVELL
eukprot:446612_1